MKKQLSEMSVKALYKEQKSTKFFTGVLIGALLVMGFISFQDGFSILTLFPVFFLPLVILNVNKLKKIKKELRLRG